jgi:hypothetical protein
VKEFPRQRDKSAAETGTSLRPRANESRGDGGGFRTEATP